MLENRKVKKLIIIVLLLVGAIVSNLCLAGYASAPEVRKETIKYLDEKEEKVMELTAASASMSVAISMIPDDTATPIANKAADLSTYLMLILCAVFLEKYLVTITGYITFKFLVPAACVLLGINVLCGNELCKKFAIKILAFGMAIFLVVPVSVKLSSMIEDTYNISVAMDEEITEIEKVEVDSTASEETGLFSGIKKAFAKLKKNVEDTVLEAVEELEEDFNNLIEGVAVMIVTSCLIPIAVLFFMVWITKTILGIDIEIRLPKIRKDKEGSEEV